jgi:hypothetical protein
MCPLGASESKPFRYPISGASLAPAHGSLSSPLILRGVIGAPGAARPREPLPLPNPSAIANANGIKGGVLIRAKEVAGGGAGSRGGDGPHDDECEKTLLFPQPTTWDPYNV